MRCKGLRLSRLLLADTMLCLRTPALQRLALGYVTSQCHERATLPYARRPGQRLAFSHAGPPRCAGRKPAASKVANEHHSSLWHSISCPLGSWASSSSLGPSTSTSPFWKYRNCVSGSKRQQSGWVRASQAAGLNFWPGKKGKFFSWCN